MHLFTWNIDKRLAMTRYAVTHLERVAERDFVVAALQEWPWRPLPEMNNHPLRFVPTAEKVVVAHSASIDLLDSFTDDSGRATAALLRLPAGNELIFVGVHWFSMDSRSGISDLCARGGAMALFRHHLEKKLEEKKWDLSALTVIMGDFNVTPHVGEMTSEYCLFALKWPRGRDDQVLGHAKRAWKFVEPTMPPGIHGTFCWKGDWSVLDHVVLTQDLERHAPRAEVFARICGHDLVTPSNNTRGESQGSDHLPVACTIHYQ
jgi:endonuclease/exonuclease/phosphatase family metal-dependent hydrolase